MVTGFCRRAAQESVQCRVTPGGNRGRIREPANHTLELNMRAQQSGAASFELEQMEERRLMSGGVAMSNGYLLIHGTKWSDRIIVRQIAGRISVQGFAGSVSHRSVRAIVISGGGGDDGIIISSPLLERGVDYVTRPTLISGGDGNDLIYGSAGTDLIFGGYGNDTIGGAEGNDLIAAGAGNDSVDGGTGDDRIVGQDGYDRLSGGDGNDTLDGGADYDILSGGAGRNLLADEYGGAYRVPNSSGSDVISARLPVAAPLPILEGTPVSDLSDLTPSWRKNSALYGILGPDLYNGIFVDKTIPNYWRA
jgi:hypothetical protein